MTQEELNYGLHIEWMVHEPVAQTPFMKVRFWFQVPTLEMVDIEAPSEDGESTITIQRRVAVSFAPEILGETHWEGTNDYAPLWNKIEEVGQDILKTLN
jgi:hypothetical protein